jgi:hypothetical protein
VTHDDSAPGDESNEQAPPAMPEKENGATLDSVPSSQPDPALDLDPSSDSDPRPEPEPTVDVTPTSDSEPLPPPELEPTSDTDALALTSRSFSCAERTAQPVCSLTSP